MVRVKYPQKPDESFEDYRKRIASMAESTYTKRELNKLESGYYLPSFRLESYGCVIRPHPDDSEPEDQMAITTDPLVARRMIACWNFFKECSLEDIEDLEYLETGKNIVEGKNEQL